MKLLLMICLLLFCMGADEITPEPPIEEPTEEPIVEPIPEEPIAEPMPEVIPEIPPEPTSEPAQIVGCTDPQAANYIPPGDGYIVQGDDSCIYFEGCMDKRAMNYADAAVRDDGSCVYLTGCTDPHAVNFVDYSAYGMYQIEDGSCVYPDGYEFPQPEEQTEEVVADFAIFEPEIIADCHQTDGERICL